MGISRRLAANLVRDVSETHPRVQAVVKRLSEDLHIEPGRVSTLVRSLMIHSIEDLGAGFLADGARRLRKIESLRGSIAEAVDHVITLGALPEGMDRTGLSKLFDSLQHEMDDLKSAARFAEQHKTDIDAILAGIGREGETGRPLPPRQEPRADGLPLPGQHSPVELPNVMGAMRRERPARAALVDRALREQGDAFGMAIMAETQGAQERALAETFAGMRPKLSPAEEAELREAVGEFGRGRARASVAPGTLGGRVRAERIAGLPEPLRSMATTDNTILGPLAEMDADGLRALWDTWQAKGSKGNFRDYAYSEMRSFNRPYQAEFAAAFQTGEQFGLQMLKDPAAFDPTIPGGRRVNPREGGTDLLGIRDDGEIWYIDDKSHRGTPRGDGTFEPVGVSSVSAYERRLPDNMRADADEMEAAIQRIRDAGGTPDPKLVDGERRVRACGQALESMTAGWTDADFADPVKQAAIKALLDAPQHNIKLKLSSTLGSASGVTDRLSALGIDTLPPFKARP
jgi:hypothetical protein